MKWSEIGQLENVARKGDGGPVPSRQAAKKTVDQRDIEEDARRSPALPLRPFSGTFGTALTIRPIFHQLEERIEAHIFVSFIAYCLLVTLKNLARPQAPGLTPRAIVEKFAAIQMVDLHVPTADGRHLVLARHTQPSEDHELLLRQFDLALPKQPAPKLLS